MKGKTKEATKRFLAYLLAFAMVFTNSGMTILAEEIAQEVTEAKVEAVATEAPQKETQAPATEAPTPKTQAPTPSVPWPPSITASMPTRSPATTLKSWTKAACPWWYTTSPCCPRSAA